MEIVIIVIVVVVVMGVRFWLTRSAFRAGQSLRERWDRRSS